MIVVDQEFKSLIPPLTDDEFKQLEENCRRDGIRDALIVWPQSDGTDILIDGHNRWAISAKNAGIPFNIKRMEFSDREAAIRWIILNQFGRRNLSAYDRSILALKLKPMIAEKAKETQGTRNDICQKSDKSIDTKKELAKVAGVSHDTIHKVEVIEAEATPKTKELVRQGKLSINQAYNSTRDKKPDPVQQAKNEHREYEQKKTEHTVSIQDAQIDKINKDIINRALLEEIQKLLNTIEKFGFNHSSDELNGLSQMIDRDESTILSGMCERSQLILEKIKYGLQRRN